MSSVRCIWSYFQYESSTGTWVLKKKNERCMHWDAKKNISPYFFVVEWWPQFPKFSRFFSHIAGFGIISFLLFQFHTHYMVHIHLHYFPSTLPYSSQSNFCATRENSKLPPLHRLLNDRHPSNVSQTLISPAEHNSERTKMVHSYQSCTHRLVPLEDKKMEIWF